jgi:hypothetical protein
MSGCHDPESGYNCRCFLNQVQFEKEIKGIDLKIEAMEEVINSQEEEINILQEKISEKYANPNVIVMLERLGKFISLNDRKILFQELHEKVRVLENGFKQILNRLNTIENFKKPPHKCPVCDGSVKILIDPDTPMSGIQGMFGERDENGMYYKNCISCEGKGIVWG